MNDNLFIIACIKLLGIKARVQIKMNPKAYGEFKDVSGACETRYRLTKVIGHVIIVNLDSCYQSRYSINDVIAHELVHAKMIETGIHNDNWHHDTKFQKVCKCLEREMKKAGFEIGKLFSPITDLD
jgi:hypothetical protein